MRNNFPALVALATILILALAANQLLLTAQAGEKRFSKYVDDMGRISLPADYQTSFLYLGTFTVSATEKGPTTELHGVYARPEDVRAFKRDKKFPDGAVLVKEVYDVAHGKLTTGHATWATKPKIWFVMIKDAKGRFEKNPLWGDGWGWALFEAKDPKKQVATNYRADCRTCHLPARKDDWIFLHGYPVLDKQPKAR